MVVLGRVGYGEGDFDKRMERRDVLRDEVRARVEGQAVGCCFQVFCQEQRFTAAVCVGPASGDWSPSSAAVRREEHFDVSGGAA